MPLYKSYFLGLNKIGLENEEDEVSWTNGYSNMTDKEDYCSSECSDSLERTKSAPVRPVHKIKLSERPSSCFPIL